MPGRSKPLDIDIPPPHLTARTPGADHVTLAGVSPRVRSEDGLNAVDLPRADPLAPARGLILGLAVGALLWIGIFALAWRFFS